MINVEKLENKLRNYENALTEIAKIVKLDAFSFNEVAAKVYETALKALDKEEV